MTDIPLYKHQRDFLASGLNRHVLVWGTGSGKTRTAVEWMNQKGERALIIVPKGLKAQWHDAVKKWGISVGYAIVTKEEFRKKFMILGEYKTVVVDECHYFLGMKSSMSKALAAYFKAYQTQNRLLLSATVYRSSPWDIYRLMELMEYQYRPNYRLFDSKFFHKVKMGPLWIPKIKAGKEVELADYVRKVGSIVRLEDCVDVPEQVFETEFFDLTKDQAKGFKDAWDPLPIVRFTREHQICGGSLKGDEYNPDKLYLSDKADRIVELAGSNPRMVVVCRYRSEMEFLRRRLHDEYPNKTVLKREGGMSQDQQDADLKVAQQSEDYVLLANAACAEGWELPLCPLMVFYSYDFALLKYVQMMGRIQRMGHIKKNTYLSLITKGTIDEDIFKTVTVDKQDFHLEIYSQDYD